MHPSIASKKAEIAALCRAHHVQRLEVFGSAVREDFDMARSDADFLVEFEASTQLNAFADYFDLKASLEELLGRPVDLVMPSAVRNRYFLASIQQGRELIYGA